MMQSAPESYELAHVGPFDNSSLFLHLAGLWFQNVISETEKNMFYHIHVGLVARKNDFVAREKQRRRPTCLAHSKEVHYKITH